MQLCFSSCQTQCIFFVTIIFAAEALKVSRKDVWWQEMCARVYTWEQNAICLSNAMQIKHTFHMKELAQEYIKGVMFRKTIAVMN